MAQIQESGRALAFQRKQDFLNHPRFTIICGKLFRHRNNAIQMKSAIKIWESHAEGQSIRQIAKQIHNSVAGVFRAVKKLEEWMILMEEPQAQVIIRPYNCQTDQKLVYASWRNAIWFDKHPGQTQQTEESDNYYKLATETINEYLRSTKTIVNMAVLQDNPDQIIGYSVMNQNVIIFCYVKLDYRRQGIATLLTKDFKTIVKPMTKIGKSIARKHKLVIEENEDGRTNGTEEN